MSIKSEVVDAKKRALGELTTLRDEARVRIHLLSQEARQRWDELETAVDALEQRASQEGERAAEVLGESARKLSHTLSQFVTSQMVGTNGVATSVRSIMTGNVRTCSPSDSLSGAAQVMWEADCGVVPVVDEGRVVGLLTDRDICMATHFRGRGPEELRVGNAMSKQVYSCSGDDSIGSALSAMAEHGVRRLPVLTSEGHLAGIVALADVARHARALTNSGLDSALLEAVGTLSKRHEAPALAAE